jgi:hypothetical protein
MVKASIDVAMRAELDDLMIDLLNVYSTAREIQFQGKDLSKYILWNTTAIGYVISAQEIVRNPREREPLNPQDITAEDLKDLTNRIIINYKTTLQAYDNELEGELKQILYTILLCLIMMKYAN